MSDADAIKLTITNLALFIAFVLLIHFVTWIGIANWEYRLYGVIVITVLGLWLYLRRIENDKDF